MSKKYDVQVCTEIGGKLRRIIAVRDHHSAGPQIFPMPGEYYHQAPTPAEEVAGTARPFSKPGQVARHRKISLHRSERSPDKNVITCATETAIGPVANFYLTTSAIKQQSGFSMVYGQSCPDPRHPLYDCEASRSRVVHQLNPFDPGSQRLHLLVLASSTRQNFMALSLSDRVREWKVFDLEDLRFTVLARYSHFASTPRGLLHHLPGPDQVDSSIYDTTNNMTPERCLFVFDRIVRRGDQELAFAEANWYTPKKLRRPGK